MRQIIKDLCDLLLEQKKELQALLELAEQEKQIIINGDSEKLEGVVRLEFKQLSKLGAVEKKRLALHKVIASELKLPEQELTVSAIARCVEPEEGNAIIDLQIELVKLINEHAKLNEENRELINAHLEYSELMMELMVDDEDPLNNFYGGDGKAAPDRKKATGLFNGTA